MRTFRIMSSESATNHFYTIKGKTYNMAEEETNEMGRRKQGRRSNGCGGLKLHGNTWYARYTNALGDRVEVSTHTSNKEEAYKVLATYTAPIRESKSQEEVKLRLQQQIEVLELRKEVSKIERLKLDELASRFLAHRALADATPQTKKVYKRSIDSLVEELKKLKPNAKFIDDITSEVADAAMGELTKKYTAATYNIALSTYKRAWSLLSRSNPFTKIGKRKIDKSRQRQVVSEEDIRHIFDSCRDDKERAVWGVGVYTGLRCGDVCNLTYGALSGGLNTITCTPQKTKRHMSEPLVIPICPPLKVLLTKVLDWHKIGNDAFKDEPLWGEYKHRYYHAHIDRWFKDTLEKAGLKSSEIDEDGHRRVLTGFHITRLAFVSFASKYMSPLLVSKIVGHSSLNMTEHYCQNNQDALREGLSQMPNFADCAESNEKVSEEAAAIEMLNGLRKEGEGLVECLRRLIRDSVKMAG